VAIQFPAYAPPRASVGFAQPKLRG
jgi:hypothetical protein